MTDYYRPQQDDCSDCLSVKEALLQEDKVREITIKTCYEMTKAEIIDKAVTQFRNRKLNQIKKGKQQ